jgi:biofilm PGA synthesis protein PgaD
LAVTGNKVLIDSPQLLSRRRRIIDRLITGFMWIVYSYLWVPLISLVAWLLGFEFAYDVMIRAGGYETFIEVLWFYSAVVAAIFVVIAGWSLLNRYRFANRDRRHAIEPVSNAEIAAYFDIREKQLTVLRQSRISHVSVNHDGQIVSIDAGIIGLEEESTRPVGPKGAVADNESGDDNDEDESVVQGSA